MQIFKLRILAFACVLIVPLFVPGTGGHAATPAESSVSVDEFRKALQSQNVDRILELTNTIRQMHYVGHVLPFVVDLWEIRRDKHPELPWRLIRSDIIRLELADILVQALRNDLVDLDEEPLHKFVLSLVRSTDIVVAKNAIWTLAVFDDEADVAVIRDIALQQARSTFRVSVVTLAFMCNSGSTVALEQLEREVTKPALRAIVIEAQQHKRTQTHC